MFSVVFFFFIYSTYCTCLSSLTVVENKQTDPYVSDSIAKGQDQVLQVSPDV